MDTSVIVELLGQPYGFIAIVVIGVIGAFKYLRDDALKRDADALKREEKYDALVEENKQESRQREDKLMAHIERYDESLGEINSSIQGINASLSTLTDKVDDLEQKIR